jgi:shikimate kinase
MNIIIIGMTGVGKTTIAKLLSKALDYNFADIDKAIEDRCGVDIPTIFAIEGESGFRYRETEELSKILSYTNYIISTGGGIVTRPENLDLMSKSNSAIIYLTADIKNIIRRVSYNIKKRPLLDQTNLEVNINNIYNQRHHLYTQIANIIIDTTDSNINKTLSNIVKSLKENLYI